LIKIKRRRMPFTQSFTEPSFSPWSLLQMLKKYRVSQEISKPLPSFH